MRIVRLFGCPVVRLAAVVLVGGSAFAWEGPKLTRDKSAPASARTWSDVKAAVAASIAKTGEGYFAYSRKYNDIGPIDTSGTLTDEELHTQFALACVLASPITVNGATVKPQLEKWIADKALMNVNNDFVGRQGHVVVERDGTLVIAKYLWGMNGGSVAVAFYNPTDAARKVSATARELCLAGTVKWTNRFDPSEKGEFADALAFDVPAHGAKLVMLSGKPVMRETYRPECAVVKNGATVFDCIFVPKDGDYRLSVETAGAVSYKVRVNGLVAGAFKGPAALDVRLLEPENRISLEGLPQDALKVLRVTAK